MKFKHISRYLLVASVIVILNSCSGQINDDNKVITMNPPINIETESEIPIKVETKSDIAEVSEQYKEALQSESILSNDEHKKLLSLYPLNDDSLNVIRKIKDIEIILMNHYEDAGSELINQATLAFLRKDNYGYNNDGLSKFVWSTYAGNLKNEVDFDINVHIETTKRIETIVDNLSDFSDPISGEIIDFYHMIVVTDLLATEYSDIDYEDLYYDSLLSWGGDLETLMTDVVNYSNKYNVTDNEKIKLFTINALGSNEYSFPLDDLIADIDGFNISVALNETDMLLSDAIYEYYNKYYCATRIDRFINFYGSMERVREIINVVSFRIKEVKYSNNKDYLEFFEEFSTIQSLVATLGNNGKVPISDQIRLNVIEVFLDVITNENNKLYQKINIRM